MARTSTWRSPDCACTAGVGLRGDVDFVDPHLAQRLRALGANPATIRAIKLTIKVRIGYNIARFFPTCRAGTHTNSMTESGLTYRDAGVDIDAGDELVERIKPVVKRTMRKEVLAGVGGFGALVEVPLDRYRKPVLVSGTDGVGTKLRLAIDTGRHDKIGIDLVAMCVNDIVVSGAEPLFFLDYYATGKLRVEVAESVIRGIAEGCMLAGCALVGGETAEMPGMYHGDDYDLAGFAVGVVERDRIIDGTRTAAGDVVIGLASSGPHSNGYSLIRKLVSVAGANEKTQLEGATLFDRLLTPTRIYVKSMLALAQKVNGQGIRAHHRRRPHRQHSARTARRHRSRAAATQLGARSGVRLAGEHRQDRGRRDVPHLQLRHRHGGRGRPGDVDAALACLSGRRRDRKRHRPGRRAARAAWSSRNERVAGGRGHLRPRQQHGSHRAQRPEPRQRLPRS